MNVVLVYKDGTVVTPASESILEGITLASVLQLARDRGHDVQERRVTVEEGRGGGASRDILEGVAGGTAAAVTPIAPPKGAGLTIRAPDAPAGEPAMALRQGAKG